jgi:hypothetical protein
MRNDSTVRVKIVVHDPTWLTRWRDESNDIVSLVRRGLLRLKQFACGLRGHDYALQASRRRMALHCDWCGHSTVGWEIGEATSKPKAVQSDRARYLELLRRRS